MTPKKKQPVKARKMWACSMLRDFSDVPGMARTHSSQDPVPMDAPVFVIPATQEAYLKLVHQMACAMYKRWQGGNGNHFCGRNAEDAEAALAAIGIHNPTR